MAKSLKTIVVYNENSLCTSVHYKSLPSKIDHRMPQFILISNSNVKPTDFLLDINSKHKAREPHMYSTPNMSFVGSSFL